MNEEIVDFFNHPKQVMVIAEACDNHMGNMDDAREMCRLAKIAGADVIKFQHHLPDEEMLPDSPMSDNFDEPLYDFLLKHALKLEDHVVLKNYCEEIGITYLCTPFSAKAAEELDEIGASFYKIGSGELRDLPSLERIAKLGKPMILSTGMSTLEEIEGTYQHLRPLCEHIAFLNCVSEYPPKYEDLNILFIDRMIENFPAAIIGHSDHTPDLYTCFAAVARGAKIIEKHVILDKRTPGPDQSVSIDFRDLSNLVDGIRKIEAGLSDTKVVHEREQQIREWAYRSIVLIESAREGDVISREMLTTKRPGTGIPSAEIDRVVGKTLNRNVDSNSLLSWDDLD